MKQVESKRDEASKVPRGTGCIAIFLTALLTGALFVNFEQVCKVYVFAAESSGLVVQGDSELIELLPCSGMEKESGIA